MKKTLCFLASLVFVGFGLITHAQTAPPPTTSQPKPRVKAASSQNALSASDKGKNGSAAIQNTQQLGQKFIRHSHEDVQPIGIPVRPRKIN